MAVERPAAADEVSDDPELPDYPGAATGTGAGWPRMGTASAPRR